MKRKFVLLFLALLVALTLVLSGCDASGNGASGRSGGTDTVSMDSWNKDAKSLKVLQEYVEKVTDEDSESFIPVEDRIAVFDMDGTLYAELAPTYLDQILFVNRVNDDPSFHANAEEKKAAKAVERMIENGEEATIPSNFPRIEAKVYAGMTLGQYKKFVRDYAQKHQVEGFRGMTYKEAFFQPMVEVVKYLNAADFQVYICSGSDRFLCREITDGVVPIAENHVIGTDVLLKASDQKNQDGLDYVYEDDDKVIRTDQLIVKNLKMNKVSQIAQEIGQQPVLSFGNSSGDESMATYVTSHNRYESMAFMLIADDDVRDYGDTDKAAEMSKLWKEHGWQTISMKNDFRTIYGDNVEKSS